MAHVRRRATYDIGVHPRHGRLYRVTVTPQVLTRFFEAVADIDVQNLRYVPLMRFSLAKRLAELTDGGFASTLRAIVSDRHSGGFTIGAEGTTTSADDYLKLGTAIAYVVGPANFDSMSGTYYARFDVRHTDASDSYLRQAYRLFTLHTDGTFVEEATDWLLMMKFAERNAVGGESRILHLDDWEELRRFSTDPLADYRFTYISPPSKNVSQTICRSTFFMDRGHPCICFIDQFVQPETQDHADYLCAMSESMERSLGTVAMPLPVGDLIVLNNRFWLHGRAAFEINPGLERELMRIRGRFSAQ
jgi:protein CsiD